MIEDPIADDLLKSHNYSQALKHVTKKLKKAPTDKALLSYKARIAYLQGDLPEAAKVCKEIASSPTTNFDVLRIVQTLVHDIEKRREQLNDTTGVEECYSISETLWKGAIKAQRSNAAQVDYIGEWISQAIETSQWPCVVQGALAMEQALPKSDTEGIRNHWYQQILARWLSATQSHLSPKTKSMQKMLARGIIEKAFAAMPAGEDAKSAPPGKWIATKSELALFAQITGENPERLSELLKSSKLDPAAMAEGDELGAFAIGQDALRALKGEDELRSTSLKVLEIAKSSPREDWRWEQLQYWQQAFPTTTKDDASQSGNVDQYLQEMINGPNVPRAARVRLSWYIRDQLLVPKDVEQLNSYTELLAKELAKQFSVDETSALTPSVLQNTVYHITRSKVDLAAKIKMLDCLEKVMARNAEVSKDEPARVEYKTAGFGLRLAKAKLNLAEALAFDYQTLDAPYDHGQSPAVKADQGPLLQPLVDLVQEMLTEYPGLAEKTAHLLETDYDPANEALLLAARGLSTISLATAQQEPHLLGVLLLNYLVEDRKQDARARSLLVNCLRSFGLNSLADDAFSTLRIKGITTEKCYPSYLQRIGSINPSVTGDKSPVRSLQKCLGWFSDAVGTIWEFVVLANENGNYQSSIDFELELQRIRQSPTRALCIYEKRRIERLASAKPDSGKASEKDVEFKHGSLRNGPEKDEFTLHGIHATADSLQWASSRLQKYPREQNQIQRDDPLILPPPFPLEFTPEYLLYLRIVDSVLHDLVYSPLATPHPSTLTDLTVLDTHAQTHKLAQSPHLTPAEQATLTPAISLGHVAAYILTQATPLPLATTAKTTATLLADLQTMTAVFDAPSDHPRLPTWHHLQTWYLEYELLRGVVLVSRRVQQHLATQRKKEKGTADFGKVEQAAKELHALASTNWTRRRGAVAAWRERVARIDGQEMLGALVSCGPPSAAWETALAGFARDRLLRGAGAFVQSSLDSFDRLLRLKIDA